MTALAPQSEAELAEMVRDHHGSGLPLSIRGGDSRGWQVPGAMLSLAGLSGVIDYQPGEMVLTARAATPVSEILPLLAAEGQCLAFEPPDMRPVLGGKGTPTLGGVLSCNASGPRRLQVGACRDHLLGLRFVDGRGRVIKSGGRVMKNVTGLDLGRALAGAYGSLGVISEITLKTLPQAPASLSLALHGLTLIEAQSVFAETLATPFEISGAAFYAGTVWLRLEGLAPQVQWRRQRLLSLLRGREVEEIPAGASDLLWQRLRDVTHFADLAQPLWRVLVKPRLGAQVAAQLEALGGAVSLDWGGGLIWLQGGPDPQTLRAIAPHATLVRPATLTTRRFPPQPAGVERLSAALRRSFDPAGILNPGLMEG